jgi:TolB protein
MKALMRRRLLLMLLPVFSVLLLPASGLARSSTGAAFSGTLAYTKIGMTYELFSLGAFDEAPVALSKSLAPTRHPVPSPDGAQIAFMSTRAHGRWDIYVSAANGTNVRQLTNDPGRDEYAPRWSPDGKRLVYYSWAGTDSEIRSIAVDGTDEQVLTSGFADGFPDYSPDGSQIVFARTAPDGNSDLYLMNADGSNPRAITNTSVPELYPVWSPDGTWIAFCRAGARSSRDIWIVHPDGSGAADLTSDTGIDVDPSWAPDSRSILFAGSSLGPWSLESVSVDGGKPKRIGSVEYLWPDFPTMIGNDRLLFDGVVGSHRLQVCVRTANRTRCLGSGLDPVVSPDGKKVLFIRNERIRIARVGSGGSKLFSKAGKRIGSATWSPNGRSIAYVAAAGDETALYVLNLQTGEKRQLFASGVGLDYLSWGRNGLIAYTRYDQSRSSIWAIEPSGKGRHKLISSKADDADAAWSPSGSSIAFLSDRSGYAQVYVRAAKKGTPRAITDDLYLKGSPFWAPGGNSVGYTEANPTWGDQRLVTVPVTGESTDLLLADPLLLDQGSWER